MAQQPVLTAIIYDKKGRILSIGQNSYVKTHPMQARLAKKHNLDHKIFLHAELSAIIKCADLSSAHKIFISRHDSQGNPRMAKPCVMCQDAIAKAGIRKIEYTVDMQ